MLIWGIVVALLSTTTYWSYQEKKTDSDIYDNYIFSLRSTYQTKTVKLV